MEKDKEEGKKRDIFEGKEREKERDESRGGPR